MINQNYHDMCVHIMPEVKKIDTTAMTTATNETCIGWWDENLLFDGEGMTLLIVEDVNLLRRIFLVDKTGKFLAVD